ncbi:MAG: hypothetical protein RR268_07240, partial [Kiritimatiellia bacterium]
MVTFKNIPFSKFRVIVYTSTDATDRPFKPVTINATDYCGPIFDGTGGITGKGSDKWGKSSTGTTGFALKEGVNYVVSDVLEPQGNEKSLTVKCNQGSFTTAQARGCIAAIQIVEVTAEVKGIYTREAGSSGDWSAAKWTKDGTASTVWTNATGTVPTYAQIDVANAQSLALTTDVSATSVAVFGTGDLALTGSGALQTSFFDATKLNGTLTLGTTGLLTTVVDTGADATVALETTADRTYSSAFLLRGAGKFKKIGAGTATIATPSCPILLDAGGLTLTGAASSKVTSLVGTTLTVNGAMTVTAETQIAGKLIKNGSGDLSVSNVGNVADVTVAGGRLNFTATSDGKLGNVTMETGTTLNASSAGINVTIPGTLTLKNSTTVILDAGDQWNNGDLTVTGGIAISGEATIKGSFYGNGTVVSVGSGKTISGTGTLTLTKNGGENRWEVAAPIAGDLKVVKA